MCQYFQKHYSSIFSVHKLQRISELIAWIRISHLALKAAKTSRRDATSIILTSAYHQDIK